VIIFVLSYSKKHKDIMWCWARSVSDCCFFVETGCWWSKNAFQIWQTYKSWQVVNTRWALSAYIFVKI